MYGCILDGAPPLGKDPPLQEHRIDGHLRSFRVCSAYRLFHVEARRLIHGGKCS